MLSENFFYNPFLSSSSPKVDNGEQDAAKLEANTDAPNFAEKTFWQIFFFLIQTKELVFGFKEFPTFT